MAQHAVSFDDVLAAAARIEGRVTTTPLVSCASLSALASAATGLRLELLFKCELFQRSGSFKARGASNAVACLAPEDARKGVCTHSSGNHAAALAYAAGARGGCPAFIVMPSNAPAVKRAATVAYGGAIIECAPTGAAREAAAREVADRTGATFIHPSEDPRVIAGQGTLALEMLSQARGSGGGDCAATAGPPLDAILVPVGGGGMVSGVAIAARGIDPRVLIIGAEPAAAADAARSLASGVCEGHPGGLTPDTIADGLRTTLGPHTWPIVRDLVHAILTVDEGEIGCALRLVYERAKLAIEPSAAVGVAAALSPTLGATLIRALGEDAARSRVLRIGVVLCGGNADVEAISAIMKAAGGGVMHETPQ